MKKLKLLLASFALLLVGASTVSAQSWVAPTIAGEDPVSGEQYKVMNVGAAKYLDMGQSWFGWGTTAILSDAGINFTMTADGDNWKFIRTGIQGVFTSGNEIPGDAMHVDNTAHTYGITKMSNGYYQIHDAGTEYSTCWGYIQHNNVWGPVAHANASTIGTYGEWVFLSDLSGVDVYKARLNLYNLYLKAVDEGADTDAAATVYNNSTATVSELNAAYNALNQVRYEHQLAIASNNNPRDITEWVLTNPDFSTGDIKGWETNYESGQQATNIGYQSNNTYTNGNIVISQFIEAWHSGNRVIGDGYLRQTVSGLPEGKYVLDCDAIAVNQGNASATTMGALLFITADGSDYTASLSTGNGAPQHFSTQFLFTGEGNVIFGLKTVSTTANWIAADNFKVTFYGIDLSAYATQLATEVTTFNGYENSIDAAAFANLQEIVGELNTTYTSSQAYAAAIAQMQAINAYAAALAAANADLSAKMNADVLSALNTEIGKAASVTLDGIAEATTDLTTAIANATASIANYVEAKEILDAAKIYDAAGQASYAANETIADIQAAYDDGTLTVVSADQKTAAKAALADACKAQTQPADGCDMSPWIVNANFDGSIEGWTVEKKGNGWTGNPYKDGTIEYWTGSTTDQNASGNFFDFYQKITSLPNGAYTISADLMNSTNGEEGANWNGGGNAGLYGKTTSDEKRVLVTTDGATNNQVLANYTTEEILVIDGELRLGVKNINPLTGRWFVADNFKLTYVRQLTAEEEAAIAKEEYDLALEAAQAITQGSIPEANYQALQDVITAYTLQEGSTAALYEAATQALNTATTPNAALVEPYATWKQLVANGKAVAPQAQHPAVYNAITLVENYVEENLINAEAMSQFNTMATTLTKNYSAWLELLANAVSLKNTSNNNADANTTLAGVITTQTASISSATVESLDDANALINTTIPTATSTLKAAMTTYVKTAEPTNDECFDLTFLLVNPHFTEGEGGKGKVASGWTLAEGGYVTEHRLLTHNFEAWHAQFDLSQTITDLPKGTYKVTLQGFARHDGADTDKTNLYCGIVNQKIKDINDEYSTSSLISGKPNMGDSNGESNSDGKYRPNGMSASYYFFQETNDVTGLPFYTNEVQTLITEPGDLKIGFKCESTTDWVIWDNFHLYYYGSAIAVTIDENLGVTFSEDIENANVTLKRTFSSSNWNTFCVPFDIDNDKLKTTFGNNVAVAEYSEDTDGSGDSSVDLKKMDTPTVTANVPVLILTPETSNNNTYTFNGVTIEAGEGEPKVEGKAIFDFVGTYAASTTIAEGDYFLASNKLYRSKGETTIKGTRAYIKAKEASATARIANFFIDGVNTTNIDGLVIEGAAAGKIYNLNGQEVKTPKKGLYIQNGKKISVK